MNLAKLKDETHLDPRIKNLIEAEMAHCKQHKIKIQLISQESVDVNGGECSGFFVDEPKPKIVVAVDKPLAEWLPIFVHESCHKDQFLENVPAWSAKIKKHFDPNEILDQWLNHACELTPKQLSKVIKLIIELELDCEKRAVQKIRRYDLPMDPNEYTQKANAYIWQHRAVQKTRCWGERPGFDTSEVWKEMSVDFYDSYAKINSKMFKLFLKHCG